MPKIVYCIHSLHRAAGMERVLTLKANALSQLPDYQITIVTAALKGRRPAFDLDPKVRLIDLGLNEHIFRGLYFRRLNRTLQRLRPDICISMGGTDLFCLPRCTDGSVKIAESHFSHDKYLLKYGSSAPGRLYARLRTRRAERAVSRLDAFVVLTKADRDDWRERVPVRVEQIYNPLTFSVQQPSALERKRCVAIGRLDAQKNFPDMIRAWKAVVRDFPDWTLDIYGEGRQREMLERLIASEGLSGKVNLRGRSSQVRREMLDSSCLVLSSTFEGFPMVLLEAAACGLPMVSYDCPCGPSEIVRDGVNGFLVRPGDIEGLATAIESVISDDSRRKAFGQASYETSSDFTLSRIISRWDEFFRSLIPERH